VEPYEVQQQLKIENWEAKKGDVSSKTRRANRDCGGLWGVFISVGEEDLIMLPR
jgi:hypothetical protein